MHFSIRPPDTPDESLWIDETVASLQIEHKYLDPDNVDVIQALDELLDHMDEPVFNSAYVYQSILRRHIGALGYKVLLIGDGGDEVFGGYAKLLPMFVTALLQDGKQLAARRAIQGGVSLTGRRPSEQVARLRLYRDGCIGARTCQEFRRGYDLFWTTFCSTRRSCFPKLIIRNLRDCRPACHFSASCSIGCASTSRTICVTKTATRWPAALKLDQPSSITS